jgi:hypothetical protein
MFLETRPLYLWRWSTRPSRRIPVDAVTGTAEASPARLVPVNSNHGGSCAARPVIRRAGE